MLASPLAPSAASWMKFDPAASCTSSAGVSCHIVQSVVYANVTAVGDGDTVDHQLRVARVRRQAAERVAPDQPIRPRRLGLDAPRDRLAHARIAVGETGAGEARHRRAALPRVNLAVDGRESRLVLLDDEARLDGRVGASRRASRRRRSPPPRRVIPRRPSRPGDRTAAHPGRGVVGRHRPGCAGGRAGRSRIAAAAGCRLVRGRRAAGDDQHRQSEQRARAGLHSGQTGCPRRPERFSEPLSTLPAT